MKKSVLSNTSFSDHSEIKTRLLNSHQIDFRQEVIYFLIVDRFHDGIAGEEERRGIWDRGEKSRLLDKTWDDWGMYWGGNHPGVIEEVVSTLILYGSK